MRKSLIVLLSIVAVGAIIFALINIKNFNKPNTDQSDVRLDESDTLDTSKLNALMQLVKEKNLQGVVIYELVPPNKEGIGYGKTWLLDAKSDSKLLANKILQIQVCSRGMFGDDCSKLHYPYQEALNNPIPATSYHVNPDGQLLHFTREDISNINDSEMCWAWNSREVVYALTKSGQEIVKAFDVINSKKKETGVILEKSEKLLGAISSSEFLTATSGSTYHVVIDKNVQKSEILPKEIKLVGFIR